MKKHLMRLIAGSIFSLSTAAIAGVAALLVWAPPAFATRCPGCFLGPCPARDQRAAAHTIR